MKYRLEFKHGFTNCGYLYCVILKALHGFQEVRALKSGDVEFFFKMFQMRFSKFSKFFRTTWNSPNQPIKLTQK